MTPPGAARIELSIFHTNDMHAHLEAMARLSGLARRLRAEAEAQGRVALFWDAGDAADRRLPLCSLTKGAAFSPILNAMGYSLQTMGNAISLPYGPQAMQGVAARADFPILAANCRDGEGPLPAGLRETVLVPLPGGLIIGVVGLTAPWGNAYEAFGLRLPDFRQVAYRLVSELDRQGARPIVVLSHLGLEDDRRLAEAVPGIDLIVGAHSHHRLPGGEECQGVLIAQAGDYAQALGRVDLTLEAGSGRVLARSAQVIEVPPDEPPDPAVLAAVASAEAEVAALMAQPIGDLQAPLELDHFRECGMGNLAADALRERMGADAAMVASGQFHQGLPAGTVTLGQLDAACFSSANPGLTVVRGAQILAALERGLDPGLTRTMGPGFRGAPVGMPQISGMWVAFDPDAQVGGRVQRVWIGEQPLEPARLYRLAHTDAETSPGTGYLSPDEGQPTQYEVPTILREAMADYLRQHSPLPAPATGRWVVV